MAALIHNYQKDEDDIALADIISLKISDEKKNANVMRNEWAIHQYHLQMQASYCQLQYLQQQQMMTLMRNSTTKRVSKKNRPPISTSSSNSSLSGHRPNSRSNSHSELPNIQQSTPPAEEKRISLPKRRQSLGKKIKRVFSFSVPEINVSKDKSLRVDTSSSKGKKNIYNSYSNTLLPDSPNSSVSSRTRRRYDSPRQSLSPQLLSPASSTVSSYKDRRLSFNSVVKLHETFSPEDYDRRSDMNSTCQKLTPALALKIKEDLNSYKLKDMYVHPDSRHNTHFFM